MAAPKYTKELASKYSNQWATAAIAPKWKKHADWAVDTIVRNKARYEYVSKVTGVPWYVIAVIHYREATFSFKGHLHNGDPLTARTRKEPKGYPKTGNPPFTWEYSAIDALKIKNLHTRKNWSIEDIAWVLETYNGKGYLQTGKTNPYLWSGTQHYRIGKYTTDHGYDARVIDEQFGTMSLLKVLFAATGTPAPVSSANGSNPASWPIFLNIRSFLFGK